MSDRRTKSFVPASRGGEQRVRAMVGLARRGVRLALRYRLRELQLLTVPCAVALAGAWLPAIGQGRMQAVMPALAFCLLILAGNGAFTLLTPWADQHLWPSVALLLALRFCLALATRPPDTGELLAPAAVVLITVLAVTLIARRPLRWLEGRHWPAAPAWLSAGWLPLAAGASALAAFWWVDVGWGFVLLVTLLATRYSWRGGGAAAIVVAAVWIGVGWYAAGQNSAGLRSSASAGQLPATDLALVVAALGLPGLGAVITLYASLATRATRVAFLQGEMLVHVAIASAAAFACQGAVAVAAYLGILPLASVSAPFLSAHPAQLAFPAALLGLLLQLSNDASGARGQGHPQWSGLANRLRRVGLCFLLVFLLLFVSAAWRMATS